MINLLMGVYWFDEALQSAVKAAGWPPVTRAQSLLFANISAGEVRPIRLAANLGVSRQAVSQMIVELEARGLLKTEPDPQDRRARIVSFAESSTPLRNAAGAVLRDLEAELRRRIGDDAVAGLATALSADWGSPPDVAAPKSR